MTLAYDPNVPIDRCADATDYYNSRAMITIQFLHISACLLSIVITVLFYLKCRKYFYFNRNCTLLIQLVLGTNMLHGISIGGTQIYHLIVRITAKQPCDLLISNKLCFCLRYPAHISMCIYVYAQVAITIERCIAVYCSKNYEKHKHFSWFLVGAVVSLSVALAYASISSWDLTTFSPYCSNVNPYTYQSMFVFICYVNAGITTCTFVCFMFARFSNLRIMKRNTSVDTSIRYQLAENETVFNIITPEITFHFVFSLIYAATNAYSEKVLAYVDTRNEFRTYLALINTIPYYSFLSPLCMWIILYCQRRKRHNVVHELTAKRTATDMTGIYFTNLQNQWK